MKKKNVLKSLLNTVCTLSKFKKFKKIKKEKKKKEIFNSSHLFMRK